MIRTLERELQKNRLLNTHAYFALLHRPYEMTSMIAQIDRLSHDCFTWL